MEDPRMLLLLCAVFIALNCWSLYRAITNEAGVRQYAETHPKAALFRRLFGVERTIWFMRKVAPWFNAALILAGLLLVARIVVR